MSELVKIMNSLNINGHREQLEPAGEIGSMNREEADQAAGDFAG